MNDIVIVFSSESDEAGLFKDAAAGTWRRFADKRTRRFVAYINDEGKGALSPWKSLPDSFDFMMIWEPRDCNEKSCLLAYKKLLDDIGKECAAVIARARSLYLLLHVNSLDSFKQRQTNFVREHAGPGARIYSSSYSHIIPDTLYENVAGFLKIANGNKEKNEYNRYRKRIIDDWPVEIKNYLNMFTLLTDAALLAEGSGKDGGQELMSALKNVLQGTHRSPKDFRQKIETELGPDAGNHEELLCLMHELEEGRISSSIPLRNVLKRLGAQGSPPLDAPPISPGITSDKILILAKTALLGNCIKKSFQMNASLKVMDGGDGARFGELIPMLEDNKRIPILLAGYDEMETNDLFWSTIRCRKDILNPVIVLGHDGKERFLKRNMAFFGGAVRYHAYLQPPWTLSELLVTLQGMEPLFGNYERNEYYEKYGHTSMVVQLTGRLHAVKCVFPPNELPAAEAAFRIALQMEETVLQRLFEKLVKALEEDRLYDCRALKQEIDTMLSSLDEEDM